ncbi:MAG: TIGR00159 family protein [Chthonomonadales bacterium]|nr:TIGR00159 family protein [Chthonomonadales bacterium]
MNWADLGIALKYVDLRVVIDVLAIAWLIYRLLLLAKGTRAWQIIGGLMTFFAAVAISDWLNLYALNWMLRSAFPLGPVALVILFLPELRHALEEFGRPGFWGRSLGLVASEQTAETIEAVVVAVSTMSVKRIGALIVFERQTGLDDIIATGTPLNATPTSALVGTLFYKGTPLHDGAVIIREGMIVAASCTLPLTASPRVDATVHTRHKAALGMSEESDAVVVIVSEETGIVSIAVDGRLIRGLREETLRERLMQLLDISDKSGIGGTPIGQVASRVGDVFRSRGRERRRVGATPRKKTKSAGGAGSAC